MKRSSNFGVATLGMALVMASPLAAQQMRGGAAGGTGPRVDTSKTFTVQGEVVSFRAAPGQAMPQLTVREASGNETAFVLGPFRYLQAQNFAAEAGDRAEVTGWVCASCAQGMVVGQVKNLTRGLTLVLRNADGTPVWTGPAGQGARRHLAGRAAGVGAARGMGMRMGAGQGTGAMQRGGRRLCAGGGPDLSRTATFAGAVVSFAGGPGEGFPTLVMSSTQGDVAIVLSPYRALMQAGYTPVAGAQVEVKAAPVSLDGQDHWVALAVKDVATGLEVVLRDPATGLPLVMGRGPRR
ncbi:MAG: hypothetical protein B7Z74_00075 [Deltaproteobacteria bacterium 21-66-5]|nr:MAG: hypothetical protein B7Z74_00075 [Deltaproteobacteria bacterium 21-66-5]OYW05904.1 MAG: hypothetical protein B7Z61_04525 [Acidobacteria bacterium 37-71-11]HQT94206.1 hypothetical protein [Thermoanaerobaculaceae bacterium]HQU33539.1 hypothetical protein [Thermoanaerobaculaceae bacterium]